LSRGNFKSTTSMLDLFLLMAMGFVVLFVLAFILINPTSKDADIELEEQLYIKLEWTDEHDNDLDLWLMAPDESIISFRKKSQAGATLERDDRGFKGERVIINGLDVPLRDNTEVIRIKKLMDGEYYVAVQNYSNKNCKTEECLNQDYKVTVYDGVKHRDLAIFTGKVIVYGESPVLSFTVYQGEIVSYEKSGRYFVLEARGANSNGRL